MNVDLIEIEKIRKVELVLYLFAVKWSAVYRWHTKT